MHFIHTRSLEQNDFLVESFHFIGCYLFLGQKKIKLSRKVYKREIYLSVTEAEK